eukprot:CAMPEP_0194335784 /NCGR_PEP_ID=MMETSP0171-20130528/70754_1 /TAXON_ID=218684 /ORGANISM="Corethron pennatum, Strain L29A3" /LENGTH=176 /DNA_ID=CAMNT_0039098999 /DNA_START=80 /DNA_END=607 /DNA_ORIENTATION=-
MYCGDETGAFVGILESSSSQFGYGGEDSPKTVLPSHVGRLAAGGPPGAPSPRPDLARRRDHVETEHIFARRPPGAPYDPRSAGLLSLDPYVATWEAAYAACAVRGKRFRSPDGPDGAVEHPLLTADAGWSHVPASQRADVAEAAFETLGCPALFVAHFGALAAYSAGRQCALVVDV